MKLRECIWLWGHPEGCFNNNFANYGFHGESRMTPAEFCYCFGIGKVFMVPMGFKVNRRQYNKSFSPLSELGWECFGALDDPEKIDTILSDAKEFPNLKATVFDDFIQQSDARIKDGKEPIDPKVLWDIRTRLRENNVRPLDMWMVLYTHEFGLDERNDASFKKYIEPFDGVIMWNWKESDADLIPEKFEHFKKMTPNSRRMFGCYLWNFGESKEATAVAVIKQLDFYREKILSGEAEGIVLHTNTMADADLAAYDATLEWMKLHGDEEIPNQR